MKKKTFAPMKYGEKVFGVWKLGYIMLTGIHIMYVCHFCDIILVNELNRQYCDLYPQVESPPYHPDVNP